MIKKIYQEVMFNIELVLQLLVVVSSAGIYGIIEAKWIPTGTGNFAALPGPILHHFSYYHLFMFLLLTIMSFAMGILHIRVMLTDRKKYIIFICIGSLPLSLMMEDIVWFLTMWKPIGHDEWTMWMPGWGINLGVTYLPFWYVAAVAFAILMFWLSHKYSKRGFLAALRMEALNTKVQAYLMDRLQSDCDTK